MHVNRQLAGLFFIATGGSFHDKAFNILSDHIRFDIDGIPIFLNPMVVNFAVWGIMLMSKPFYVAPVNGEADTIHRNGTFLYHVSRKGGWNLDTENDRIADGFSAFNHSHAVNMP